MILGENGVMKHVKITAFDCPDAWFQALIRIWNEGDPFQVGYGSEVTETKKLNLTIEIRHPETRPLVSDKAPCDFKYIQGYALEYLWCGEKQRDETYTYGSRINHPINQIEEAISRYIQEQQDRQVTNPTGRRSDYLVSRLTIRFQKRSSSTEKRILTFCVPTGPGFL